MRIVEIPLPQLGVNDTSAKIVEWHTDEEKFVNKGEIICTVETTKSIFDVEAPDSGYCYFLVSPGGEVNSGDIISILTDQKVNKEELLNLYRNQKAVEQRIDDDEIRITEKAKLLALRLNIDISKIKPDNYVINEDAVLKYYESLRSGKIKTEFEDTMDDLFPDNRVERIAIIGAGDGAIQIIDCLNKLSTQKAVMLFDDNKSLHGKKVAGVPIIGNVDYEKISGLFSENEFDKLIISVSTSISFREKAFDNLVKLNVPFTNVIHPSTVIGSNVKIGVGNVILANCHIGACAKISNNNFISAYCSIEHHNELYNHCSFGPGVLTSSKVKIKDRVRFGTGIFIEPHITIGEDSVIGSGAIITKDIPPKTMVKTQINYIMRERPSGA